MKETPLLFSDAMALAMVENRKGQTRRLNGLKEINEHPDDWLLQDLSVDPLLEDSETGKPFTKKGLIATFEHVEFGGIFRNVRCPFGQVGDRIWGREAWRVFGGREYEYQQSLGSVIYRADGVFSQERWRPSIFMPRWASRIEREIVGIRLERLQTITEADAEAEGVLELNPMDYGQMDDTIIGRFGALWDFINEKRGYGWEHNPWVWVLEFPH